VDVGGLNEEDGRKGGARRSELPGKKTSTTGRLFTRPEKRTYRCRIARGRKKVLNVRRKELGRKGICKIRIQKEKE